MAETRSDQTLASPPAAPPKRKRRWLKIVGVLVALLIVLVALLPTLISFMGKSFIRDAIAANVNGEVAIDRISLGWLSGQRVEGVRIIDASGKEAANVSVSVDNSILSLALGRAKLMQVTISGSIAGQVREDGSISFADLVKSKPDNAGAPKPPSPKSPTPPTPPRDAVPPIKVNIDGLDIALDNLKTKQSVKIDDLKGTIAFIDPEQPITLDLHGKAATTIDGKTASGAIDIIGEADHLFAQDGSITLRGATAKLDVKASGVPLPVDALSGGKAATLTALTLNLASDDLTEKVSLAIAGEAQVDGAAKPTAFKVDGSVSKIIDGKGAISLRAATAHLTAEATNVPVEAPEVRGEMSRLTATIVSDDLTQKIEVAAQGEGMINGNERSELSANLALAKPFEPDGTFTFAIENLTGSASGTRVPTSLAQTALAAAGIDALRDLGPTVDLEAFFPGGIGGDLMLEAKAPKASAEVVARSHADGSITGTKLALHVPNADPALIDALTSGGVFSDRPLNIRIDLTSFTLPSPPAPKEPRPLGQFAATGKLTIIGPANVRPGAAESGEVATTAPQALPLMPLERLELDFDTPALAQHLTVTGTASIGGGKVIIDERITNMFDASGMLAMAGAKPEGSVKVENLPVETILAFAPAEQADLIREVIGKSLSADVATSVIEAGLKTELSARSDAVTATISMIGRNDAAKSMQFDKTIIDATVTPALAALLQKDSANPVVLGAPANVHLDLRPILLPMGAVADVLSSPMGGKISLRDALIASAPGIADSLAIPSLDADLTIVRKGDVLTADIASGSATIKRGEAKIDVARMTIDGGIVIDSSGGETIYKPDLHVNFTELNTRQAETLLGLAPGTVANWTGDRGALDVQIESVEGGYIARANPAMPNLQGAFTASLRDEMVAITAETSKLVIGKDALQARLNPPAPESDPASPASFEPQRAMITVDGDVPMQVAISKLEFPLAMVQGTAFDSARVNIDLALRGGPLKTTSADGVKSTMSDLDLSIRAADLNKGLQFALTGEADAVIPEGYLPPERAEPATRPEAEATGDEDVIAPNEEGMTPEQRREARRQARAKERAASRPAVELEPTPQEPSSQPVVPPTSQPQPGRLDVTGVLAGVVNSEGLLDLAGGRLQMNALAENVPTAVADALGDMQGMLVAAVGPQMNATFVADDFSASSGTLDAKITSTNGSLNGLLRGREQSFRINKNGPVTAELKITTALRDRLLMKIHPILADIRTTEQPLRVTIPTALASIPADVSKLRADIEITVGKVELDSGSTTLKILSFFGKGDRATIPGEIEPISVKIHNGIVTYQKFAVHIDRYTLNYSGQIDLVKQEVNLRTEIPLKALGDKIEQLAGFADAISVPLVTRGKFGALKTSIDPDFDIGKAAIGAGFQGTLDNLLRGEGGEAAAAGGAGAASGVGGILDRIFNRDKEEEDPASQPQKPRDRPRRRDAPSSQPGGTK